MRVDELDAFEPAENDPKHVVVRLVTDREGIFPKVVCDLCRLANLGPELPWLRHGSAINAVASRLGCKEDSNSGDGV